MHPLPASEAAAATIVFHTSAMLGKENGVAADGEQPNQGGGDEGQRFALIWRGSNLSGVRAASYRLAAAYVKPSLCNGE